MTLSWQRSTSLARLRLAGRLFLLAILAAGAAALWIERGALQPAAITAAVAHYPAAPLVFLALHIAASLLFVPRTMLGLVAGLVFGLAWGIVWAALGSVLGAIAGFLVARYVNSGLIEPEALPRLGPLLRRAEAGGWRAVTVLRLIPVIPHSLTNYALGLTRLSLGGYAVGSFIGQLPMTIAYVSFGAAGGRIGNGGESWLMPAIIGAVALGASILVPRLHKKHLTTPQT